MLIKSRRMRWAGLVTHIGEKRNACRVLAWKPERKRQHGTLGRGWENNIKWKLNGMGGG
jgi:hypothetical protein